MTDALAGAELAAPIPVLFGAANVIRRHELAGLVSADQAAQAHADLLGLAIEQWPYELLAARVWAVRANLCAALTRDLDECLINYNTDRAHTRRLTQGRVPADIVHGARKTSPGR